MKFNFFAGLLVAVGGVVTALNDAAPHELQYMYNLYKTEWMLFPDAASALRLIAPKCKHKGKPNSPEETAFKNECTAAGLPLQANGLPFICTFDEFVKHVLSSASGKSYPFDADGHTLNPDSEKMANKLYKYSVSKASFIKFLYWPSKLAPSGGFPTDTGGGAIKEVAFEKVIKWFSKRTNTLRLQLKDVPDGALKDLVNGSLDKAKVHLRIMLEFRMSDKYNRHFPTKVQAMLQQKGLQNYYKTAPRQIMNVDGKTPITPLTLQGPQGVNKNYHLPTYNVPDWDATWKAAADDGHAVSEQEKLSVLDWTKKYVRTDNAAKEHQRVIQGEKQAMVRLKKPPSVPCAGPAPVRRRRSPFLLSEA